MASSPRHGQSCPWQPGSLRNAPILSFISLAASLATSGLALFVVRFADGKPVDTWPIAPSVYLSVLATLSSMILRFTFQAGVETRWWSLLLSDSGANLHTLHHVWELGHDSMSRFKIPSRDFQPALRAAGIILIMLAGNGPLLQRAVSVDLVQTSTLMEMDLLVRREPMWNLTTKFIDHTSGHVWSSPPYQDEFGEIVTELNQRRPIKLRSTSCPLTSTCTTTVSVASFSRSCSKEYVPVRGAPTLPDFETILLKHNVHYCTETGIDRSSGDDEEPSFCRWLNLDYQLAVSSLNPATATEPELEGLPWLNSTMPPNGINYTSYFREDVDNDMLTVQRCNFTSAFVDIPIEITEGSIVKMQMIKGPELSRRNKGTESIPAPIVGEAQFTHIGIRQIMSDLYGGYVFFDNSEGSHTISGIGPRQSLNQTSITSRPKGLDGSGNPGYSASFLDPLANFTDTLHELSLRYALRTIPSTPQRLEEMDDYWNVFSNMDGNDPRPRMEEAVRLMETESSPRQRVAAQETKLVTVYRVDFVFAVIAVSITSCATILVGLLFTGWRRLGRRFSMSPVEIAKAFDAALLYGVGSNTPGNQIAKSHGELKLRYGETYEKRPSFSIPGGAMGKRSAQSSVLHVDDETKAEGPGSYWTRLTVDLSERISAPVKGRIYV